MAKWLLKRNKADISLMSKALGISEPVADILANRGIGSVKSGRTFLDCPVSDMYDPYLFKDMEKGIAVISEAVKNKNKITVYGDYDVDGVMSITILLRSLKALGAEVSYYVPHRQTEGYGLNEEAVKKIYEGGTKVLLTCDNGISAVKEIELARRLGMKTVIIDHHEPGFITDTDGNSIEILPDADAVIDHKRKDCTYPYKNLCAAAISYKFAKALFEFNGRQFYINDEMLIFAAIATVCDIVELMDENRIIVKNGLLLMNKKIDNTGLKAIISAAGIMIGGITEYHLGFIIGPSVNSAGRLESASEAVELFKETDPAKAEALAQNLVSLNTMRKNMTEKAAAEIISSVENGSFKNDRVLVLYSPSAHESVAGIVASRVKEQFNKPVIIITDSGDTAKGSARSIEGYNIFEELNKNRGLFVKFGGHAMAAGLSLEKKNIDILRERLNSDCPITDDMLEKKLRIERKLSFEDIDMDLAKELRGLAPFGKGNPKPLFGSLDVTAQRVQLMGKNKNIVKFTVSDNSCGKSFYAIGFDIYEKYLSDIKHLYGDSVCCKILNGESVSHKMDMVYSIDINSFNSRETVQLLVQDIRLK